MPPCSLVYLLLLPVLCFTDRHCQKCKKDIKRDRWSSHLHSNSHKNNCKTTLEKGVQIIQTAFKERIITYRLSTEELFLNIPHYFQNLEEKILHLLDQELEKHRCIKINMELFGYYFNPTTENYDVKSFNTVFHVICEATDFKETINEFCTIIDKKADEFAEKDSGWILINLLYLEININKYNPLRASSFIDLPEAIKRRNAIINIRNDDDYCFAWSIVAAFNPPTGLEFETSSYPHPQSVLNLTGSKSLKDVKINVPQAVIRGRDVALQCSFDMEGEKLYSLKWYRETSEFYRYSPMNNPPVQIFPVDGIKVNSRESRPIRIILEDVSREISGSFSCEVTAEMPSYYTIMHTAVLKVVDLPRTEPYITGLKRAYSPGDILNANCTSEFSYPPANITWHINGFHVRNHVLSQRIAGNNNRSAVVSHVRYRLPKKPSPGGIKVQCTAEIYDVYLRSTAFTVELTDYPDWPPTTRAPTTSTEEYYDTYDNFEIHPTDSPSSLWWFLLPFSCASTTSLSLFSIAFMVLAIVFS